VALPKELERMDPTFVHLNASEVPAWEDNGVSYKLIAGEALGRKSPVPVYSNLYLIEIKASRKATIPIGYHLFGESGLYILEGQVYSEGHTFTPKQLLVAHDASLCTFEMEAGTTTYLFGGEPFPEERFIHWNFVSSERSLIEEARQRWQDQQFPKVPGETDFVPLPK
jgi:redox-sensitive bicupin YhaK (pirin superfamily)